MRFDEIVQLSDIARPLLQVMQVGHHFIDHDNHVEFQLTSDIAWMSICGLCLRIKS